VLITACNRVLVDAEISHDVSAPDVLALTRACSEVEAEKWQSELESQIRRVVEENAHQGRVLMVSVCKLKAQVDFRCFARLDIRV
jgi:predicted metal-dependent TIM-barrel fold hydrolase